MSRDYAKRYNQGSKKQKSSRLGKVVMIVIVAIIALFGLRFCQLQQHQKILLEPDKSKKSTAASQKKSDTNSSNTTTQDQKIHFEFYTMLSKNKINPDNTPIITPDTPESAQKQKEELEARAALDQIIAQKATETTAKDKPSEKTDNASKNQISDKTPEKTDLAVKDKPKEKALPDNATKDKPKEKASEKVDNTSKDKSTEKFVVQIGVFGNAQTAEVSKNQMSNLGAPVKVVKDQSNGKTIYRVQAGPFDTKAEADQLQKKLAKSKVQGIVKKQN